MRKNNSWKWAPGNRFFLANQYIVDSEIRTHNTVTFQNEVDATEIETIRSKALETKSTKPSYTTFIAKAAAIALNDYPYANRRVWMPPWWKFWATPRLQEFKNIDIAVACERNLPGAEMCTFIDVLRNVDSKNMNEIGGWLFKLSNADEGNNPQWKDFKSIIANYPHCVSKRLIQLPRYFPSLWEKYRGGAVLISSPAKYGVDNIAATWPWSLGISFGFVATRPVVRSGKVVPRKTFSLTLNFDRRIMAGAQAARFFNRFVQILESPSRYMKEYIPRRTHKTNSSKVRQKEPAPTS